MEARHLAACQLERTAAQVLAVVANNGRIHKGDTAIIDGQYQRDLEARARYALDQAEEFIRQLRERLAGTRK